MRPPEGRRSADRQRDDEDAAVVLTIVAALAASTAADNSTAPAVPTVWADPAHRFGLIRPSAAGWWASGMPR